MKYFIKTFGCQMNISDSERIDSFMLSNKHSKTIDINSSDIVIINTCGVRQMAEDRVFGLVRNLKKNNPKIKIIITGCLANRKDIHRRMKDVDLFSEIKDIENILKKLNISSENKDDYSRDYFKIIPKYKNKFQAYVPIMTGCDNFCSYCVVPYARGREISRPAKEILSEIKNLLSQGYLSINLLGQNVNSYLDKSDKEIVDFPRLLKKINDLEGNFWIHFVSSHPKDMSDEAIETITSLEKVCENIHLPIQSGNDEVLKKMNRKYTKAHYLKLIKKIEKSFKKNKPESLFSITTDIIVGFPGETRELFKDSAKIIKKAKFDMVFFGQYSPRPGTAAWKMEDDVSAKEKETREKNLNEILKKIVLLKNKKYIGKNIEVLIEKKKGIFYFGKTRTLKNIKVESVKNNLLGKIVLAKITKANIWNLEGEIK